MRRGRGIFLAHYYCCVPPNNSQVSFTQRGPSAVQVQVPNI